MRSLLPITIALLATPSCGANGAAKSPADEAAPAVETEGAPAEDSAAATDSGSGAESANEAGADNEFQLNDSATAKDARGSTESKIKPTPTETAMRFFVVDKEKGPIEGIVISMTGPDGKSYYTEETDSVGYAEVLVPNGQNYDLVYLSLGRRDVAAKVPVRDKPNQNIKLTLRYKGYAGKKKAGEEGPRVILDGVNFDTAKATIRKESYPNLDRVVEYMTHKKSSKIQISGHTDNVGKPKANKTLSERRAQACRDYLIKKGIDASRITAVGYGDERPIAPNDTAEGRQKNRRIEATEQ
jgi:outer membrane protein OmpA-like peptidoglycan-associated protein